MVDDVVRRFCLWLGWRPATRDVPDDVMIRRLMAEGHTRDQARTVLDNIEEAEIDEFLREKFPPDNPQS